MNPAALKTQPQGPRAGRHPHRQHRRLRRRRPAQGRLRRPTRSRTARSRATASSRVPMTKLNREAVAELKLSTARGRPLQELLRPGPGLLALRAAAGADAAAGSATSSARTRPCCEANTAALKAGYNYGETTELLPVHYRVAKADLPPGTYRKITGNEALALGLVAAAAPGRQRRCVYAGYPITPASDILHHLVEHEALSASRPSRPRTRSPPSAWPSAPRSAARLGVTATSGPGICLKSEAHRPGRDDRAAAGHHRRAARRPQHRPADQDRAGRPACRRCSAATASAPSPSWRPCSPADCFDDGLRGGPPGRRAS